MRSDPKPHYSQDRSKIAWNLNYINAGQCDDLNIHTYAAMSINDENFGKLKYYNLENMTDRNLLFIIVKSDSHYTLEKFDYLATDKLTIIIYPKTEY